MLKKTFLIETELYNCICIEESIKSFEWFKITFLDSKLTIEGDNEDDIDLIFNEFMNFVLALQSEYQK